jgi:long-chain fatty acid transport protein
MSAPRISRRAPAAALVAALVASATGHATNGYFSHGYGTKTKGTAGVAVALPQDALVIAANPAGLIEVGTQVEGGLEIFLPDRSSSIEGNAFGPDQFFDGNGREIFFIPEFGYSRQLGETLAVGLAVYGNGGMNTDYEKNPFARFGSTNKLLMNLEQLFVTPALAWQFMPGQTLGIGVNLAYQRFQLKGLSAFAPFSADPQNLTDSGHDHGFGAGVRVGWLGEVGERIKLGASWQSKTQMEDFDAYAGLFAQDGGFDVPENWIVGAALSVTDATTVGVDWQTIKYADVHSVGNSINKLWQGNLLGSENGPGFGWEDMSVLKLAVVHRWSERLTLRAGYSQSDQPIPREETFFNIVAPGVVEEHLSFGATWAIDTRNELSVQYTHAFEHEVKGRNSIPPGFPPEGLGGGEANLELAEDSFGVSWAHKL